MSVQTVIALAFTTWVNKVRKELGTEEQKLSGAELHGVLGKVFSRTRKGFISDVAPAIQTAYAAGLVEAGVGMNEKTIAVLATNYASRIVDYSNKMTMMAAAEAYQGVINRKKQPKTAFTFMRDTFGADRRAVRSLLKMFDQDELKNNTLRDIPSKKKRTMDRYVVAAIKRRAEVLGGEEAHATKELAKAFGWNLAKAQGKAPKGAVKRWITARDELVCKNCGPMNFVDVGLDEKFEMPDGKIIWSPQAHINCFPSWVPAGSATGITGADSRWYEGKLVIVNTASGREVSVTPNHPVLTDKGWVAAGDLVVGDNLVSYRGNVERKLTSRPDDEGIESPISQVFEAIRESSGVSATRVPVTPEQFHGDGVVDTEVDVVFSDRLLGNDGHPTTLKLPPESKLLLGSVTEGSFPDASLESQLLIGGGTPSSSDVSGTSKLDPVDATHVSHPVVHSLRSISGGNTSANEPFSDYLPGDVVSSGEFLDALTGLVELDQVADIRAIDWRGHVYNLQTGGGWYTANSIVVHNCRCKVVMVVEVKNAKAPTSAFQRSRVRKSEGNPYRRRDGQFASRNENNWAPTYQGGGSYGSHLSRVRAPEPQRARVAVLERPRQDDINAEFARLTSQLGMMPQVQAKVTPYDNDVRAVAVQGSLPQLDTISTPSSLPQLAAAPPQVAPAPLKLDWTAPVMAPAALTMPAILESIPKLDVDTATNVMLNLPEALPEMVVDANATAIQQNSEPGTVYETEEIMVGIHITSETEKEEGLTVGRLAAGTTLTSDLGEIERTLSDAYMVVADDVTNRVWEEHDGSLSIFESGRSKPVDYETLRSAVFGYAQEQYQYHLRSLNVTGGGPDVPNSADWAFDRSAAWSDEIYQDTNDIEAAQLSGRVLRERYHFDRLISSSAPTVYTMSSFNEAKADYSYEEGMLVLNEDVDINLPDAETSSGGRSLGEVEIDFAWDEYED